MSNATSAAFPLPFNEHGPAHPDFGGLTKREYFAGLAMQGLLADPNLDGQIERIADSCVKAADALLAALSGATP